MGSDKFGLDRSTIFGSEVPMSDVAQGAGLGAMIGGVKPLAAESGKFSAKYDSFVKDLFKNWSAKQKSPAAKVVPTFPGAKEMIMQEGRLPGGSGSDYSAVKHLDRLKKVGPGSASGWKSILKNVWRGHKPALGKGALVGGGVAAILSSLLGRKKEAASYDDMQKSLKSQLQTQALRDILNVGLLGAGAAGTLRGGQGLINLLSRSGKKLPSRAGIAPLPVPYKPSFREEDEEKEAAMDVVAPGITKKRGLWWYYPALLGAGAAGAAGGWKAIDSLLDKRRRKELDDEVDEARGSFRDALTSQYKEGSDSELGRALDELHGKLQKQALTQGIKDMVGPNNRGTGLGMYASYAIPSSILGYLLVKGMADKGSKAKRLDKAQKQRALKQQKLRPAELYAVPSPIEEEE